MNELPVIFLAGPTASGKTGLAMQLADAMDVSLINVDAAQVYRGMNIGTAKPGQASLKKYPHALIDIRDPAEVYDAAQFVRDARELIEQAHRAGTIPVLVGGTLFYFSALENGMSGLPDSDAGIRLALEKQAEQTGWDHLYARLERIDPTICLGIDAGDRQRIQRALEIYELTGKPPSQVMKDARPQPLAKNILKFNLYTSDRKMLHRRLGLRFDNMLEAGLVEEVRQLKKRSDLHLDLPSMRCVGYRQVWQYLAGEISAEEMKFRAVAATRQLAKRQLTWLRHQRGQIWLSSEFSGNIEIMRSFF